jgi:hypothetical protein
MSHQHSAQTNHFKLLKIISSTNIQVETVKHQVLGEFGQTYPFILWFRTFTTILKTPILNQLSEACIM